MRQLKITLAGSSAYLMNNPASMKSTSGGKKRTIPTPEEEAESKCYWLDDVHSSLAVPATQIHACLIRASARYKVDKQTLWSILVGACHVEPELIPLHTVDYQIDSRTAIVQKNRIFRCRAKVMCPWEIEFELHFDPEWLPIEVVHKTLPEVIKTAGNLIGIGDYRVEKKGPFGKFYLRRFELLAQREEIEFPEPDIIGFDNFTVIPAPKKSNKKKASA
jgi:hypothetical protein